PRFSTKTSAVLTSSANIFRPRSDFRLSVMLFLFMFRRQKNEESASGRSRAPPIPRRAGSPEGGSILITSAPSHPSVSQQLGPASYCVRSSTRIPSSAFAILILRVVVPSSRRARVTRRYVVYAENRTVVARALSLVITFTTAGLPDAYARSSAGRIS